MHAEKHNLVTCSWAPCAQPGTDLVDRGGVDLEYCDFHAERQRELESQSLNLTETST